MHLGLNMQLGLSMLRIKYAAVLLGAAVHLRSSFFNCRGCGGSDWSWLRLRGQAKAKAKAEARTGKD